MMETYIAQQLVSLVVTALFGIVTGFLGSRLKKVTDRDKAIEQGVKAILRHELMDDYERFCVNGEPLNVERRREIDECYHAYAALGGNGTGKTAYEAICSLDMTL